MKRSLTAVTATVLLLAGLAIPVEAQDRIRTIYMHGMPYDVALKEADTRLMDEILALLKTVDEARYWSNAAKVLGFAAGLGKDGKDGNVFVAELVDFIEGNGDFSIDWSSTMQRGRTSAILALGYTVNFKDNDRALKYLMDSVHGEAWDKREVAWLREHSRARVLRMELCLTAALGLALTGHPKAADKLAAVAADETMNPRVRSVARSARIELDRVKKLGLEAYHQLGQ